MPPEGASTPADVINALVMAGHTVATAESLTGGLLCAAFTDVPGSSAAVRGGLVAYATDVKARTLGVGEDLLRRYGAVSSETAAAMADGARGLFGADVGIATTGVAGPDSQEGRAPGTVYIGLAGPDAGDGEHSAEVEVLECTGATLLTGDRASIRRRTVELATEMIMARLSEGPR